MHPTLCGILIFAHVQQAYSRTLHILLVCVSNWTGYKPVIFHLLGYLVIAHDLGFALVLAIVHLYRDITITVYSYLTK